MTAGRPLPIFLSEAMPEGHPKARRPAWSRAVEATCFSQPLR